MKMKIPLIYALVGFAAVWASATLAGSARKTTHLASTTGGNPLALGFYDLSGSGSTVDLEFEDQNNVPIPVTDTNGATYSAFTITVPASSAIGAAYSMLNNNPVGKSYHIAALPNLTASPVQPFKVKVRCETGSVSVNFGALVTGAAGTAGSGFNTGYVPTSSTPIKFLAGDWDQYGSIN